MYIYIHTLIVFQRHLQELCNINWKDGAMICHLYGIYLLHSDDHHHHRLYVYVYIYLHRNFHIAISENRITDYFRSRLDRNKEVILGVCVLYIYIFFCTYTDLNW